MPLLTRQAIFDAPDIREEEVEVPDWSGSVIVRGMTAAERDATEEQNTKYDPDGLTSKPDMSNAKARLVVKFVFDGPAPEGKRVFTDEDAIRLGQKSAGAVNAVWIKIYELSGLTKKRQDQIRGNSETGKAT